ncbi:alkyl/aryl-sulfatase [Streptomyces sp. TLI_171]|uniref:alkyl/aryl-sulfatase n=1 Tax=Streptomyces sp. TLI_171 TaxID=1938859 RepID=UPI000C5D69F3|nr:alkyl sulfatase dimerization domain-containing protein [Streptomyces sp. TLI_171]RKE19692.1 alkyl sulfatase BDS1-like metallo-beta-lactamase superfamily hydrolase [Streptomyces sp. TLI_171]
MARSDHDLLDYSDRTAFEDADRGLIAKPATDTITTADGSLAWDFRATDFLAGDCPDTVHPSLWRQSQLTARAGLFEVREGVYQIRGFDLSNMTLIEGERGVIVVDPLVSEECAAAGLALYRAHRGDRPVTAVLVTHSHADHFGGILGVIAQDSDVPIVAPAGFMEHSVAENVYAGTAMLRRGDYYSGGALTAGPTGLVGMGLGFTASHGNPSLLPATLDVTHTGQEERLDGVLFRFQLTPDTEAPSELNFFLPELRALCMAENATHNLHNILTLRGALVRDARIWSRYLTEAIELFAADSDVVFASHHWPTWGTERLTRFLSEQRDLYGYLHDQTLRLLNQGLTGPEIAEQLELPPALASAWHARGYYGSVSHNVKAVYQRYMGWYDGNPASLWEHPPTETAKRYADCLGGVPAVLAKAREYADAGDLRFAAQLLKHAVFAAPENEDAKEQLAQVFERLGHSAENATWRNCYLMGAQELRTGPKAMAFGAGSMAGALSVEQVFDSLAIRVNGPKAWDEDLSTVWRFTDLGTAHRATLRNGVLVHGEVTGEPGPADLTVTLTKPQLFAMLAGKGTDGIGLTGDGAVLSRVFGALDEPDPAFPIVTP